MARTDIPVQQMANFAAGDDDVAATSGDAANDHSFTNTGRELLIMRCSDASQKTASIISVADEYGRTGDVTITCPASTGLSIKGPFPPSRWNQSGGVVHVDLADATGVTFSVVRLPVKE
jgi:hypothetical protein